MVECKNYASEHLYKITQQMVNDFVDKATRAKARFPNKDVRLGFFSKHGFEERMKTYLAQQGIIFTW